MTAIPSTAGRSPVSILSCLLALYGQLSYASPTQNDIDNGGLLKRQNSTLPDCLSATGIEFQISSSANWTAEITAWNSRISPVPAAVVFPRTEDEVSDALACARDSNTKVTTLGGNRSFASMGFGRNDGALIVNLRNMKVLEYDESTGHLTYGGPVMISEAADYLWNNFQRALPHGRCPDVGMAGVAASGFGTLSRISGTVLDNIVSVRVALANGTIVNASADENENLYWGVRGAASSMGVVLTFSIQTMTPPSQVVTNYTIAFPAGVTPTQQNSVDALLGTQKWAQSSDNSDLLSIRFSLRKRPTLSGFYYGTSEEFQAVAQSLLSYLPNMTLTSNESDFWTSEDIGTAGLIAHSITPRRYFYIASVTIPSSAPLDNSTAWSLFSGTVYAPALSDASPSGFVDIWGGAYTRSVAAGASAWKHDDNLLLVRWDLRTSASAKAFSTSSLQTVRGNFYGFVDAYKAAGGSPGGFTTYRDAEWTVEQTREYLYGGNWDRLQVVKTAYDPGEMFNTDPQAVPALPV